MKNAMLKWTLYRGVYLCSKRSEYICKKYIHNTLRIISWREMSIWNVKWSAEACCMFIAQADQKDLMTLMTKTTTTNQQTKQNNKKTTHKHWLYNVYHKRKKKGHGISPLLGTQSILLNTPTTFSCHNKYQHFTQKQSKQHRKEI